MPEIATNNNTELGYFRSLVEFFYTHASTFRAEALVADQFYQGAQWTEAEIRELRKLLIEPKVYNLIRDKVNTGIGISAGQATIPQAKGRNEVDVKGAEAVSDVLRYVFERNNFEILKKRLLLSAYTAGFFGVEVRLDPNTTNIALEGIHWRDLGFDPASNELDFSDARYMFRAMWIPLPEARIKFNVPNLNLPSEEETTDNLQDPASINQAGWFDRRLQRLRVIRLFYKLGEDWHYAIFSGNHLFANGVVPFVDERGRTYCPIKAASIYQTFSNARYGPVKDMIDAQREVNIRRTQGLARSAAKPIFNLRSTPKPQETIKAFMQPNTPVGLDLPEGTRLEDNMTMLDQTSQVEASLQFLGLAQQHLGAIGPDNTLRGAGNRGVESGRAAVFRNDQAQLPQVPLTIELSALTLRLGEAVWYMVRQFWTQERTLSITDDEGAERHIVLNRTITQGQRAIELLQDDGVHLQDPQQFQQIVQQIQGDPRSQQPVRVNSAKEIFVDFTIREESATDTARERNLMLLGPILQNAADPLIQNVLFNVFLANSDFRGRDEAVAQIRQIQQQNQQAAQQQNQQAEQLEAVIAENKRLESENKVRITELQVDIAELKAAAAGADVETADLKTETADIQRRRAQEAPPPGQNTSNS